MRLAIAKVLGRFDDWFLGHRFYGFCQFTERVASDTQEASDGATNHD